MFDACCEDIEIRFGELLKWILIVGQTSQRNHLISIESIVINESHIWK